MARLTYISISLAGFVLLSACGGTGAAPTAIPETRITPLLATTELRVGTQRVAFLLETPEALVTVPEVKVAASPASGSSIGDPARAVFHEWPFGTRGSYVTQLTFDEPGEWRLLISVEEGGTTRDAVVSVPVTEESVVRDIGQIAPFSASKTWESSGGDLSTITSHYVPDPQLYRMSIAEALITGKPSVIAFASPAFCTTPTCGPQVETVSELRQRYAEQANFIHVEVYDNPHEIQGDLRAARLSPLLSEWGIDQVQGYSNESWVFVLGADGRIAARFEAYATLEELEEALRQVLAGPS